MDRYCTPSAVIVILRRIVNGRIQILMQKRKNTGFADGKWDLSCSGHVEKDESMKQTCIRECYEELGISVDYSDLNFLTLIHKRDKDVVYYNAYFYVDKFIGTPKICEPNKCSDLNWFDIENIPKDTINDRVVALSKFNDGIGYIEYGWKK